MNRQLGVLLRRPHGTGRITWIGIGCSQSWLRHLSSTPRLERNDPRPVYKIRRALPGQKRFEDQSDRSKTGWRSTGIEVPDGYTFRRLDVGRNRNWGEKDENTSSDPTTEPPKDGFAFFRVPGTAERAPGEILSDPTTGIPLRQWVGERSYRLSLGRERSDRPEGSEMQGNQQTTDSDQISSETGVPVWQRRGIWAERNARVQTSDGFNRDWKSDDPHEMNPPVSDRKRERRREERIRKGERNLRMIQIQEATFYRHFPRSISDTESSNPPLFKDLTFALVNAKARQGDGSTEDDVVHASPRHWAIIGPSGSGKTTFLQAISGRLHSTPGAGTKGVVKWPLFERSGMETPLSQAIQRVGFDGEQGLGQAPKGAYLSARYESRREIEDFSLRDYLRGNTELNAFEDLKEKVNEQTLYSVAKSLRLTDLLDMPISNLSNGQTRRARIAKALLGKPGLLLLDEPFMGLDPPTLLTLSPMLRELAEKSRPRLLLTLRPQDPIPDWITDIIYLKGNCQIGYIGEKHLILEKMKKWCENVRIGRFRRHDPEMPIHSMLEVGRVLTDTGIEEKHIGATEAKTATELAGRIAKESNHSISLTGPTDQPLSRDGYPMLDFEPQYSPETEKLIDMKGAVISYGEKTVLGNWSQPIHGEVKPGLWWEVLRGQRWGIFGPNGSGKTTLLSLITSDHPKAYSLPIEIFGRSRLSEPGKPALSIFELQSRIGQSSPEIHNHIPRSLTIRQVIENAYSDTLRGPPTLDDRIRKRINRFLIWFEQDLRPGATAAETPLVFTPSPWFTEAQNITTLKNLVSQHISRDTSWADTNLFGALPFGAQRVLLFLRAIVKEPDIVILDEAFSGMDDMVRDRCLLFLAHGELKRYRTHENGERSIVDSEMKSLNFDAIWGLSDEQALVVVSHVPEEIPGSVRNWICLPDATTGKPPRMGVLDGPIEGDRGRWKEIWGM